jgi:hypothetical protein
MLNYRRGSGARRLRQVIDGKIVSGQSIFDRLPFRAAA